MLKRQRSSPSFVQDICASPDPPIDVSERMAKRRRHVAPPHIPALDKGKAPWIGGESDGEEDIEGGEQYAGGQGSEQAQRLEQAGEYRHVNSLLHDLHAEQRHRTLFSTSLPPSNVPEYHHAPPYPAPIYSYSAPPTTPGLIFGGPVPQAEPSREAHRHMPSFTISLSSKDSAVVDYAEVQRVTERYEDTNRCVRNLIVYLS